MDAVKKALRKTMLEKRQIVYESMRKTQEQYYRLLEERTLPAIVSHLPATPVIISGFYPMNSEIDCAFLLRRLISLGHTAVLPVMMGKHQPLLFRTWDGEDTSLIEAQFHTKVPGPNQAICDPDVLLVPLLAFAGNGMRLGYGGGYYDRTLTELRSRKSVVAIGLGFSMQYVEELPFGASDQAVDLVVTENGQWHLDSSR